MNGAIRAYVRGMERLSDWTGLFAMYLIFVMIAVLLLDAVMRNAVRIPLHWCVEFAQFTLAAYYFLGGAKTLKDNDHVRMDLIYAGLAERAKARADAITVLCLLFYLGVMLWGSISSLQYAIATDERRFSIWNPSMIPIKSLMVVCIVLMILQTVALFLRYLAAARGRPLDGADPG